MSKEIGESEEGEREMLPIEKGFPIERVNEIAGKEGHGGARQWYRPIYAMHKWWARRLGSVFRSICLYSLIDQESRRSIKIEEPGKSTDLRSFGGGFEAIEDMIDEVDIDNPESLWPLYNKDVTIKNKKILDPFCGGGTTVIEASRFGADVRGNDLNPVAWFVTKKETDAGSVELEKLEEAFEYLKDSISEELTKYHKTDCPHCENDAEAIYYFWVKELDCVSCEETVSLFNDYRVANGRYEDDDGYYVYDPEGQEVILVDDWKETCRSPKSGHEFTPQDGNVGRGSYNCPSCGQQYRITDATQEQGGYRQRLYAVEYYCSHCDERPDRKKSEAKGYKAATDYDFEQYEKAKEEWKQREELRDYAPDIEIPSGHMTSERNPIFDHGLEKWTDMFNERQLLTLSKLLREIDKIEEEGYSQNIKEFLLLTFSDSLRTNTIMTGYTPVNNVINQIFKTNSFDVPQEPVEGNPWGGKYGYATFTSSFDAVKRGIEWAHNPTERFVEDGETKESEPFNQPVGENVDLSCGDARKLDATNEYDAVITDPPYYDNIMYSEVSDYFYVWQKQVLEDEYEWFNHNKTPRAESIVVNPFLDKTTEDFESELHEAFTVVHKALKKKAEGAETDGVLAFTYHHSGSESWGELLTALCDVGFEVTSTYPISADSNKFISGEAVEFDIVIVARPASERDAISWNSLRRDIYRTAQKTRQQLEKNRNLSRGDIGVVEMGRCFHEYSKHHGKVERAGETMTAKEVVDEIYGVIQQGSDIGEIDVFLDLLETPNASYDDLNKLSRGTDATPERIEDMRLYRMDDGFKLGTWDDEKRIAYIQSRVDSDEELTDLDKAQFLRYRWEHGKSVSEYLGKWEITDDLRELCEGLADATGDDTYRNILESRLSDY
jgi:adenine-specific DNA methylase